MELKMLKEDNLEHSRRQRCWGNVVEGRCEDPKQGEEVEAGRSSEDLGWQQGGDMLGSERGWLWDRRNRTVRALGLK